MCIRQNRTFMLTYLLTFRAFRVINTIPKLKGAKNAMLVFEKLVEDRKELAKRVSELADQPAIYTRAPLYAYSIGDYMVDRDGCLQIDEDLANAEVLTTLISEGFIRMPVNAETQESEENGTEIEEEEAAEDPEGAGELTEQEMEEDEQTDEAEEIPLDMVFDIGLGEHTGTTLRNLVHLIYSRSSSINKATGSDFSVEKELVEALSDDECTYAVKNFLDTLEKYKSDHGRDGMEGIRIDEEKISFYGFATAPDVEHLRAYGQLAVLMNNMALNQKRIQPKIVDVENEKYAFRIWLIRLGMNGDGYKAARKILMKNLSGHTAFRTPEEAEKAKVKAKRKRDEQKAARVAAQEAPESGGESMQAEPENAIQPDMEGDSEGVTEDDALPMF